MNDEIVVDSSLEKMIGEDRQPIYLVWGMNDRGLVSLRAICTTQAYATLYRKGLAGQIGTIRVWVEKTITNHLFGEGAVEQNYPEMKPFNLDEQGNIEPRRRRS